MGLGLFYRRALYPLSPRLRGKLEVDTELGTFWATPASACWKPLPSMARFRRRPRRCPCLKAAWDAIDAMNNLAEHPLVTRVTGGRHGGGSTLTPYGEKWWRCTARWKADIRPRWTVWPPICTAASTVILPSSASCSSACRCAAAPQPVCRHGVCAARGRCRLRSAPAPGRR